MVGVAWLARESSRLAMTGGTLAVLGGFGHAVFGGAMMVTVLMARDVADRPVMAGLLADIESSPLLVPFMAAGLLGTVLGILFLGVALWRSRVVPRWVPLVLWAFLVVEFVGANLSEYATYVAGLCPVRTRGYDAEPSGGAISSRTPSSRTGRSRSSRPSSSCTASTTGASWKVGPGRVRLRVVVTNGA